MPCNHLKTIIPSWNHGKTIGPLTPRGSFCSRYITKDSSGKGNLYRSRCVYKWRYNISGGDSVIVCCMFNSFSKFHMKWFIVGLLGLCCLSVSSSCSGEPNEDFNVMSSQLSLEEERPSYTTLTTEQRAEATRQPWEQPGYEHLKPSREILESRFGSREDFVPNPVGIKFLEEFEQAWESERRRLQIHENMSSEMVKERCKRSAT